MTDTQRPSLVTNPAGDRDFIAAADAALREGRSVGEFQQLLRRQYPRAVVRARDLSGERPIVWYVYREGRWVARDDRP